MILLGIFFIIIGIIATWSLVRLFKKPDEKWDTVVHFKGVVLALFGVIGGIVLVIKGIIEYFHNL